MFKRNYVCQSILIITVHKCFTINISVELQLLQTCNMNTLPYVQHYLHKLHMFHVPLESNAPKEIEKFHFVHDYYMIYFSKSNKKIFIIYTYPGIYIKRHYCMMIDMKKSDLIPFLLFVYLEIIFLPNICFLLNSSYSFL